VVAARQAQDLIDLFFVGTNGAVNVMWVQGGGNWAGPVVV
jgi:hypothetical protein